MERFAVFGRARSSMWGSACPYNLTMSSVCSVSAALQPREVSVSGDPRQIEVAVRLTAYVLSASRVATNGRQRLRGDHQNTYPTTNLQETPQESHLRSAQGLFQCPRSSRRSQTITYVAGRSGRGRTRPPQRSSWLPGSGGLPRRSLALRPLRHGRPGVRKCTFELSRGSGRSSDAR